MKMVKSNGELIAIIPVGWIKNQTKREESFRNLIAEQGDGVDTLKKGTFSESGTEIETKVIRLKPRRWKDEKHENFDTRHEWEFMLYATQTQANDRELTRIAERQAAGEDILEELKSFALSLIKKHAEGQPDPRGYDEILGDTFISTNFMGRYIKHLEEYCTEAAICMGFCEREEEEREKIVSEVEVFIPIEDIKEEEKMCMKENVERLSNEAQLEIVRNGGGLMELMCAC